MPVQLMDGRTRDSVERLVIFQIGAILVVVQQLVVKLKQTSRLPAAPQTTVI